MSHYFIKAKSFLLEDKEISNKYLEVKGQCFGGFYDNPIQGIPVLDYSDYLVAPGLFDTHIHGIKGYDIMDGTVEAVSKISEAILSLGVTRFLPTTLTASKMELDKAIQAITQAVKQGLPGAKSEGIFLEGPYFTDEKKGAQNPMYFRDPDYHEFLDWQRSSNHSIAKIALAPEREGAMDFIRSVSEKGVLVSIAHSNATYECCKHAIEAGARNVVHLFNGMSGLHHREPGVAGSALSESEVFAEIICDGHHVHREMAKIALQIKQEKIVLITDCMRAGEMPDGNYYLGEFPVTIIDGVAKTEAGSLAGSTLTLKRGIQNLCEWSKKPLTEIWHLASLSPAKSLGRDKELGSIESGKLADFVILDHNLDVYAAAIEGEIRFHK